MAEKVLNLIPGDLERPIGHIKPNIDCPDLEQLILESMIRWHPSNARCEIRRDAGIRCGSGRTRTLAGSRRTAWLTGRWLASHEAPDTQVLLLVISASDVALSSES
jgi:hypothetical protein